MNARKVRRWIGAIFAALPLMTALATAQVAPRNGLVLHDQEEMGKLLLQRWVEPSEVVPGAIIKAHMYSDAVVLIRGRVVLKLSTTTMHGADRFFVDEHSGTDVNGDGVLDLIVREYSGGAHCCTTTSLYSVTEAGAHPYFRLKTGNCNVELRDVDGDGIFELVTCDDAFAYKYCSFAESAMPPVVYRYDPDRRTYTPDTPRYATAFAERAKRHLNDAESALAQPKDQRVESDECIVHGPVIDTIYLTGKFTSGFEVLRGLLHDHREQLEQDIMETINRSPHFSPR
jgi:hypothetical protein